MHNFTKYLVPVGIILITLTLLYFSTRLDDAQITRLAESVGIFGPVLFFVVFVISQVFAPLSGSAGLFVAIRLYGHFEAMLILYLASLTSATINYFIANIYGRPAVKKFVGSATLKKIDELSDVDATKLLIVCRLFGYYVFDIVSYALGLTNVSFRKYFTYTAFLSLFSIGAYYFIFQNLDFTSVQGIAMYYGILIISSLVLSFTLYSVLGKKLHP